jgi:hypothetical protein
MAIEMEHVQLELEIREERQAARAGCGRVHPLRRADPFLWRFLPQDDRPPFSCAS